MTDRARTEQWRHDKPAQTSTGVADFVRRSPHAFTRRFLVAQWSRHQLDASLRDGTVVRLLPDVYASTSHRFEPVVLGEALNLWAPRGLVTGELALRLYAPDFAWTALPGQAALPGHAARLSQEHLARCLDAPRGRAPQFRETWDVHIVVPRGDRMEAPDWVTAHQAGPLRQHSSPQGVRCTVPERALLDAWRYAVPARRRELIYQALWARVCTWRQLEDETNRALRVTGRRDLERILAWFRAGATSPLEVKARRNVFGGSAFRELEWQARLNLGSRIVVADALHRRAKVVIEFDGARYHASEAATAGDRERDIDLAAAGYVTVRLGWFDITHRPAWCKERLIAVINTRLGSAIEGASPFGLLAGRN